MTTVDLAMVIAVSILSAALILGVRKMRAHRKVEREFEARRARIVAEYLAQVPRVGKGLHNPPRRSARTSWSDRQATKSDFEAASPYRPVDVTLPDRPLIPPIGGECEPRSSSWYDGGCADSGGDAGSSGGD